MTTAKATLPNVIPTMFQVRAEREADCAPITSPLEKAESTCTHEVAVTVGPQYSITIILYLNSYSAFV